MDENGQKSYNKTSITVQPTKSEDAQFKFTLIFWQGIENLLF